MPIWLGLSSIWLVGIRDLLLSQVLLRCSPGLSEMNVFARWTAASFGVGALAALKLSGLTLYTVAVLFVGRRNRRTGQHLLAAGLIVSLALSAWWDLGLLVVPA